MKLRYRTFQGYNNTISFKKFILLNFSKIDRFSLRKELFFVSMCKKRQKSWLNRADFLKNIIFKENNVAPTNQVLYLQKKYILYVDYFFNFFLLYFSKFGLLRP